MNVLYYPEKVIPKAAMNTVIKILGLTEVNNPGQAYAAAVYWSYHKTIMRPDPLLRKMMAEHPIINIGGLNVTKSEIHRIAAKIFGYSAKLDFETMDDAKFIQRNDSQAAPRDIKIIKAVGSYIQPLGTICLKILLDREGEYQRMYRVTAVKDLLETYATYRNINDLFGAQAKYKYIGTHTAFNKEEQRLMLEFTREARLDLTSLDIIRNTADPNDGRIYIIDSNNIAGRRIKPYLDYCPETGDPYPYEAYKRIAHKFMEVLQECKRA